MEPGTIHAARIAQATSFPGRLPKGQSRAKSFDKAPRFTLKDQVSVSVHNKLIQTTAIPMITNLPRTSTFTPSRCRRVFSSLLLLAASVAVLGAIASSRQPAVAAPGGGTGPLQSTKIASWVMEHTANGQRAEFFVVLADQADLRPAAALQTKAAKGRYVYNSLLNKSQSTQGPILQWLRDRGLEHRSFYIVNAILVKGSRKSRRRWQRGLTWRE